MTKEKLNPFKKYEVLENTKIPQPPKKKTAKTKLSDTELFQASKIATVEHVATVAKIATVAKPTKTNELKGNYLVVYSAIKGKISNPAETITSIIGYQELAKQCNITKRTVQNIINKLISLGLIKRIEILNTKVDKGSKYKVATVEKCSTVEKTTTVAIN